MVRYSLFSLISRKLSTLFGMKGSITSFYSVVWGKMYDMVKSMYLENMCAVKIGDKQTEFFTQRRSGLHFSLILFNVVLLKWWGQVLGGRERQGVTRRSSSTGNMSAALRLCHASRADRIHLSVLNIR